MSDSENTVKDNESPTTDFVENGSNKFVLKCKYCGSKILDKKSAKFVAQEVELPLMLQDSRKEGDVQNETINEFYHIENMYTFENIGFTHTVNNYLKYLSCADCYAGPLGYFDMSTNQSYVAVSRIEHA